MTSAPISSKTKERMNSMAWSGGRSAGSSSTPKSPPSVIMRNGQMVPRLPFCAAYDGVNLRRTRTISESIQGVVEEQEQQTKRDELKSEDTDDAFLFEILEEDPQTAFSRSQSKRASRNVRLYNSKIFVLLCKSNTTKILDDADPILGFDDHIKGHIDIVLNYNAIENRLIVTINGTRVFKKSRSTPNLYVTITPVEKPKRRYKTRVIPRTREPNFEETFIIEHVNKKWMHILAMNVQLRRVKMFRDAVIGGAVIWLDDIDILSHGKMNTRLLLN